MELGLEMNWQSVALWLHLATPSLTLVVPSLSSEGANPGDLIIRSLSQSHSGIYQCSVSNRVGSAQCIVEINMPSGKRLDLRSWPANASEALP